MQDKLVFEVLHKDDVISRVEIDGMKVSVENFTDKVLFRPFNTENPTYMDFIEFMEDRCIPKTRANIQELLAEMNLTEYNPVEIVKYTHGIMYEDFTWVRFKGEALCYDDVKVRD